MRAVGRGDDQVVKLLIAAGADIHANPNPKYRGMSSDLAGSRGEPFGSDNVSPIEIARNSATSEGDRTMLDLLLSKKAPIKAIIETPTKEKMAANLQKFNQSIEKQEAVEIDHETHLDGSSDLNLTSGERIISSDDEFEKLIEQDKEVDGSDELSEKEERKLDVLGIDEPRFFEKIIAEKEAQMEQGDMNRDRTLDALDLGGSFQERANREKEDQDKGGGTSRS